MTDYTTKTQERLSRGGYAMCYHNAPPKETWWACDISGILTSQHALDYNECGRMCQSGELVPFRHVSNTATIYKWNG
jgi:hypothetical protein